MAVATPVPPFATEIGSAIFAFVIDASAILAVDTAASAIFAVVTFALPMVAVADAFAVPSKAAV